MAAIWPEFLVPSPLSVFQSIYYGFNDGHYFIGILSSLQRLLVPASLPAIVEELKQGWSFAWRSLMAGELLFVTAGLGHLLNMGRELNDMAQVIGIMMIIIAIGLITDRLIFSVIERRLAERWGFRAMSHLS